MKKYVVLFIVASLIAGGVYALTRTKGQKDCGNDIECGNGLLATCSPGNFLAGIKKDTNFRVVGKKDGRCVVEIKFVGPKTTENPLQGYGMSCMFPLVNNSYQMINKSLLSSKLENCTGELKDRLVMPISKLIPEAGAPTSADSGTSQQTNDFSRSPGHIDSTLSLCSKGLFYIDAGNGSEMKFTTVNKVSTGCSVQVEYSKNSNPALVGPKMSCLIPTGINVLPEVQKLISDKFIVSDKYSSSNVCTGALYKLIK